ncbi:PAS domain S-box-containing protein [Sedimentibacter acidaminivorans]|uniref:HTH-type transcriptional regulatory protein TyrR n=1 Tax=Sedimentibacter acidaminivorans TaxID=913099 RepID=A0ABS4G9N3_9FIRM|nr:sigma 54-interacting transcriptional regulator [Sedimentibacter acidaminivorans]MBP1924379.1 PAS domain S-box-containing protein [Sedimentibacter acidaminivorans]
MNRISLEAQLLLMENFERVIDSSFDGMFITDGIGNILYLNSAYEKIASLKRVDLLGKNMVDIEKAGIISKSATLIVLKKRKTTSLNQEFKTGRTALVTSTPIFNDKNEIIFVVTNVRDISELEQLKKKVQTNKNLVKKYVYQIEELKNQLIQDGEIIAEDYKMLKILQSVKRVAKVDTTVLILGETGVGKEEIAKIIYKNSLRVEGPFIKVNCGAIPENLLESEFFGYEKGAFTGANNVGKIGLFELADNGTIFLDEVAELPLNMQVKLLRVLQEETITRIGGHKEIKINVRIISATNNDLEEMVKKGLFREDLFYRLNVIPITIPPLRERRGDIAPLLKHFVDYYNAKYNTNKKIDSKVISILYEYPWPGNIRQIKNNIERMILLSEDSLITVKDIPLDIIKEQNSELINEIENKTLKEAVGILEYKMITNAYEKHKNVRDASKTLGIDAATFVRKRKRYEDARMQQDCKNATK